MKLRSFLLQQKRGIAHTHQASFSNAMNLWALYRALKNYGFPLTINCPVEQCMTSVADVLASLLQSVLRREGGRIPLALLENLQYSVRSSLQASFPKKNPSLDSFSSLVVMHVDHTRSPGFSCASPRPVSYTHLTLPTKA